MDTTSALWSTGEGLSFENWCEGEDSGSQGGLVMMKANTYCWDAGVKSRKKAAYVCEMDATLV